MLKIRCFLLVFLLSLTSLLQAQGPVKFKYDTVPGDPLKARIYTLGNGLKVYLSVYKDEPRFQSMIGIKAGSKNDPADHTGLAHYLEHMLFKGTDKYGTFSYEKEAILLDTISALYERYGEARDSNLRAKIYHQIDSVSGLAAEYAIPNEYDKMMEAIGVTGVNAFTSVEQTVYVNDVPSNQIENFFNIEAERFRKPVMRLFHTELEAVYEEKNRGLDNDGRRMYEALNEGLFPNHQYGTQTTIGTIEHLKSPSLKAINEFLQTYYVPNNMVIALSGDFDPDQAIRIIEERFGRIKPRDIPAFVPAQESFIKTPVVKTVIGPDAESVMIGFRFKGAASADADLLTMVDYILSNGQAGLFDLNLNNSQKVLSAGSTTNVMKDYSVHILSGRPREGQSLEEVRDLMLAQLLEIKNGNFPDWLIPAIVNNIRKEVATGYESNRNRAQTMLSTEIEGVPYADLVKRLDRLARINKQQIIDFVKMWYGENYCIVYKRLGEDRSIAKVVKPAITPVKLNSDAQSEFVANVIRYKAPTVNPVFLDFKKVVRKAKLLSGVPVYSIRNKENNLFDLEMVFDMGTNSNKKLPLALEYMKYLGTSKYNSEQLQQEFYKLACDFDVSVGEDETRISLTGIQSNMSQSLALLESLISGCKADSAALANLKLDMIKKRANNKLNKNVILRGMQNYAKFGPHSPFTHVMNDDEIMVAPSADLISLIQSLPTYQHRIDYYGPADSTTVLKELNRIHKSNGVLKPVIAPAKFEEVSAENSPIYLVNYEMKQAEMVFLAKGAKYDESKLPMIFLYNRYFGGSMSSPVFQTMRESKALAYSVASSYSAPRTLDRSYWNFAYIGTQADKLPEACSGMLELLRDMPKTETSFANAKEGALKQIQTERITKGDILRVYHSNQKLGLNRDIRNDIYQAIPTITLNQVADFQLNNLAKLNYQMVVLGKKEKLDLETIKNYGPIKELTLSDIFGY